MEDTLETRKAELKLMLQVAKAYGMDRLELTRLIGAIAHVIKGPPHVFVPMKAFEVLDEVFMGS